MRSYKRSYESLSKVVSRYSYFQYIQICPWCNTHNNKIDWITQRKKNAELWLYFCIKVAGDFLLTVHIGIFTVLAQIRFYPFF